ncbi:MULTISPECIES: serine protease [unclassified Acidovorax]|uniref:serine protease n=1 Tax=unclassified Acidovorax TaxID=2684926 RepID=UPI0028832279|nr:MULTISPECIES: serine protease [unclassified Acidovorax]
MGNIKNWVRTGGISALAALLLAACGGGGGEAGVSAAGTSGSASITTAAQVLKVEPHEQPATAVQDVVRSKSAAQSSSSAEPVKPARVALGPLLREKNAPQDTSGGFAPLQIAAARPVGATATASDLQRQLQWRAAPGGGLIAAVSVDAEGAHGLRLGVLVTQLPGSAVLRVYSQFRPSAVQEISGQEVLQLIGRNQQAGDTTDAARTWWTPDTGGAEATLEIELPPGTPASALQVAIPQASHVFVDLSLPQEGQLDGSLATKAVNTSSSCELDAVCYSESAGLRNAVARMTYVRDGGGYLCTGTLLNDSGSTRTPYFITANHCISTQTVASTLQTDWFFRAPSCNSRTLASNTVKRNGGATLLYATTATDTSFLRLNDAPPAGAVFAGWDAGARTLNSSAIGVHHPDGDLLKISFGQIFASANCASTGGTGISCTQASALSGNFYAVRWTQGLTEGGSSGSGLFQGNYLVGTLYGGSSGATCSASTQSVYGRFDQPFQAKLKEWLSPAGTPTAPAAADRAPIYRFFNSGTGAHFFTSSADERDFVVRTYPAFQYEGVAFYAYGSAMAGQSTVFRFFNRDTGAHFYTINQGERDYVVATYPSFQYEGPIWYAQTAAGNGSTPIYRFFNKRTGAHFYTINQAERDFVIATYTDFVYENVAYHAWTAAR